MKHAWNCALALALASGLVSVGFADAEPTNTPPLTAPGTPLSPASLPPASLPSASLPPVANGTAASCPTVASHATACPPADGCAVTPCCPTIPCAVGPTGVLGASGDPALVDGAASCYRPWNSFYVGGEYLLWWTQGTRVPPLVTTGPASARFGAGVLGLPGTVILHGDERLLDDVRSGARFSAGVWFDEGHCFGLEGNFLFLGRTSDGFSASSQGVPPLARPFIVVNPFNGTSQENASIVAGNLTDILRVVNIAGGVAVSHTSELWGGEANFRSNVWCGSTCSIDVLLGWRTLTLEDETRITEIVRPFGLQFPPQVFSAVDEFESRNTFHGGQIGLSGEHRICERLFVNWTTKVALGTTRQRIDIAGANVATLAGFPPEVRAGGLLTQASNIGSYSRNVFSVVPEVQVNVGYQLHRSCRAFVGYNFLYWSDVARASEQIDRRVNPFQAGAGGPNLPAFRWNDTGYWAQGLNCGLAVGW